MTFRSSWKRVLRWSTNFGKWALALKLKIPGPLPGQCAQVGDGAANGVAAAAMNGGAVNGICGIDRLDGETSADVADDL